MQIIYFIYFLYLSHVLNEAARARNKLSRAELIF